MSLFNWLKTKKEKNQKIKETFIVKEKAPRLSNPYVIHICNTTNEFKKWVLFGSNLHLMAKNFGNEKGIEVKNIGTGTPYHALLVEHISQRTKMSKLRFQSTNHNNLHKHNFKVVKQLLSSGWFQDSIVIKDIPLSIMMDAYQQQSDILDLSVQFDLDKYTHLEGVIEPNSEIAISMFPIEIEQEKLKTTRLSGKNVAPVIISVSENNPTQGKIISTWGKFISLFKKKSTKKTTERF